MALHHRPRIQDMRTAAKGDAHSTTEDDIDSLREQQHHFYTPSAYFDDRQMQSSPSSSVETYASTIASEEVQLPEQIPEYDVPDYTGNSMGSSALGATPAEFSQLFPSKRVLVIRHDDSTLDGNMNLRIDADGRDVLEEHRRIGRTLFHLRLQDLKYREFSLRRYHRNSGREVCHSVRKREKSSAEKRPAFHRSLSNALQNMRPRPEQRSATSPAMSNFKRTDSGYSSLHSAVTNVKTASLKRNDSGYSSMHSVDLDDDDENVSPYSDSKPHEAIDRNSVRLEFSNYAQVEVRLNGGKHYDFEYWGVSYTWKRVSRKEGRSKQVAFHLTKSGSNKVLATITPLSLDERQAFEERRSGGWIPPCAMHVLDDDLSCPRDRDGKIISDKGKDAADCVVAAGLIALVDDSIRRHFDSEEPKQSLLPKLNVEYIGPKRMINGILGRRDTSHGQQSRPTSSGGPSLQSRPGSSRHSSREYP